MPVTPQDVHDAAARIAPHVHRTPVLTSEALSAMAGEGRQLFFKCECLQKTGSFKVRGATNAVLQLPEATPAVATHSSGNHAQALAFAARLRGLPAHIVMPDTAPQVKQAAVAGYGGLITLCPAAEREARTAEIAERLGAHVVHPSNDPAVIAGQGTVGLELAEQIDDGEPLDAVIVPIGGGGLTAGVAVAVKAAWPGVRVFAAEPERADDAQRSLAAGEILGHESPPDTVADGLRTTLGSNTFPIVRDLVEEVITVPEEAIVAGMRLVWERMKLCIEPSAGVGVAVALSDRFRELEGIRRVGVVLCGGNVDLERLPWQGGL